MISGKLKIQKSAIPQYFLIYVMLLLPGSCAVARYLNETAVYTVILLLHLLLALIYKKYRSRYVLSFIFFFLAVTLFVRLKTHGGVGIISWLRYAAIFSSIYLAIAINNHFFLKRVVQLTVVLAVISLVFWAIFCLFPSLVEIWPAAVYWTQDMGTGEWAISYYGKGLWIYSYLQIHATRNCGIYTEPGVYQCVLNAVLFILLFWKEELHFRTEKQYKISVLIILAALISCQSTTGYIGLLLILCFFFIFRIHKDSATKKVKRYILSLVVVGIAIIFIDYFVNGTDSILYKQVIYKFFGSTVGEGLNLSEGTGRARLGTIIVSLMAILKDPFGIGYTEFTLMKNAFDKALVAASFASFAAVYGIIPWVITLAFLIIPVFGKMRRRLAVLWCLLFINTTLAQTYLLFPGLILFPIYLATTNNYGMKRKLSDG